MRTRIFNYLLDNMVCDKCEKKLAKLVTPETWREGSQTVQDRRSVNSNMMLKSRARHRNTPIGKNCRICEKSIQAEFNYCHACAYSRGICPRCGKKVLDTKLYKMSVK